MEDEGEVGGLMKKIMADKKNGGEVDYKTKSGTAWSHSYLNQKPWHPLSYPNQRRKWIAEQTNAQRHRRNEEVAREFAQEQEFFKQTALISKKEKEKVETMKAVSFMYVRPPGYNPESAKAAELEDERKRLGLTLTPNQTPSMDPPPPSMDPPPPLLPPFEEEENKKKKARPRDVFGRALPTEDEFQVLKNAPRLETGLPARAKPFGVEIRNVKCARCGTYGHQSGDRECPLKDAIMPNEENRLKRDDPLNAILAQTDCSEPLKWELKQKPGLSPPRGGFKPDDPNQQIVAEDIFDEYGGFLSGGNIPDLLSNFSIGKSRKHSKSKSKHKSQSLITDTESKARHKNRLVSPSDSKAYREKRSGEKKEKKHKKKKRHRSGSSSPDNSGSNRHHKRSKCQLSDSTSSDDSGSDRHHKRSKHRHHHHHHHHHRRRRHGDSESSSD